MNQPGDFKATGAPQGPWERTPLEREREMSGSVPHLLRQLTSEVTGLFHKEVSLARAEMREAVSDIKGGMVSLMSGGIILLAGVIVLLLAAVYGLAEFMDLWLAALIVGLVTFGLGLLNVPGIVMTIFTGSLLIVVIALPILFRMWRQRA